MPHGSEGREPARASAREGGPGRAETDGRVGPGGKLEHRDDEVAADDMGIVESLHLIAFHYVLDDVYGRINGKKFVRQATT